MTDRWRLLPDHAPRSTIPVLWCLTVTAVAGLAVASVDAWTSSSPVQRSTFWASFGEACVPSLGFSIWGLLFRRVAFGSAWISATLLATGGLFVAVLYCYESSIAESVPQSDGAGFGAVVVFLLAICLCIALIVASGVLYAMYWKRKFFRVATGAGIERGNTTLD